MQLVRRFRIPALFCALAVLLCELISHPVVNMGICDDGPYILMARTLANTGHIVYNGWAAPMLGWPLFIGAAFVKLFGFSFTAPRMGTIFVAMLVAFILQRTLVAAGINERNATLGTLALVLSPLFLMLSVTFMTDIPGFFAIVICLYGCLRALQASSSRTTIAWLCFAVATNAVCGTSRQIAWLGILVMVPSTLWLLRAQRRVLFAGAAATLAGAFFIFACLHWLKHQPYVLTVHLLFKASYTVAFILMEFINAFLDIPFLLLPVMALFFPGIRRSSPRLIAIFCAMFSCYLFLILYPSHLRGAFSYPLEPARGDWVNIHGILYERDLKGQPAIFLNRVVRGLFTVASLGGLLGLIALLLRSRSRRTAAPPSNRITWKQLGTLLIPFTIAYIFMLVPLAATLGISDRYFLGLELVTLLCLVRCYQDYVRSCLPFPAILLIGSMAIYGIAVTHNTFSFYRARVALVTELRVHGIPDTSVDNGWEYNLVTELQHANHINYPTITVPANAYVPTPPPPPGTCPTWGSDYTPHVHPLYGISFQPSVCYGPAPFAPVHYSRWLTSTPGTLYAVYYTAPPRS